MMVKLPFAGAVLLCPTLALAQYSEARDVTTVTASAIKSDPKTSDEGGCGTTGCRAFLAYDDSLEYESRWSCQQPYDPDSYDECALVLAFDEPQDMAGIQIAFLKGDERVRTVGISYEYENSEGDDDYNRGYVNLGEFTSSGETDGFEEIPVADFPSLTTEKVIEVTIYAGRDTPPNQWLSITEVSLLVVDAVCEDQYSEAGDETGVQVSAVKWDYKTSDEGGCGTDGCKPALLYDGSLERESRWSCQQPIDPDSYDECAVFFYFDEPQDMTGMKIAFLNGDQRQRTVGISYSTGDNLGHVNVGEFTSSGETDDFEEVPLADFPLLATEGVTEVVIYAPLSTPYNQWLSITEVSLEVASVVCEDDPAMSFSFFYGG